MGAFIEEQKAVNVQTNQRIDTMESSLNQKLDGLQSDLDQKINILQYSISRLTNQQHVHPEEECLIDTIVEEHCKQQNEAISPLLTEEGSGKEAVASVQTFATTSQTLAAAYTAWHNGWLIPKPS